RSPAPASSLTVRRKKPPRRRGSRPGRADLSPPCAETRSSSGARRSIPLAAARVRKNMRVYYDRDADLNLIKGKKVAIIGYGSQGHAHALNLRDSGVKDVAVALRRGSASAKKAEAEKLPVREVADAAKWADVMMMLTPDELQSDIYRDYLHANMKDGAALMFAHGLNIHFNLIEPRADLDV